MSQQQLRFEFLTEKKRKKSELKFNCVFFCSIEKKDPLVFSGVAGTPLKIEN